MLDFELEGRVNNRPSKRIVDVTWLVRRRNTRTRRMPSARRTEGVKQTKLETSENEVYGGTAAIGLDGSRLLRPTAARPLDRHTQPSYGHQHRGDHSVWSARGRIWN